MFSSSYEREAAFAESEWRDRLAGKTSRIFGLFDGEKIIGVTGIVTVQEDSSAAQMVMSFIMPAYRGRGLSRLLYAPRIEWAVAQPQLKKLGLSHRDTNEPSRRACLAAGFTFTRKNMKTWPDGQSAEEFHYVIDLDALRAS